MIPGTERLFLALWPNDDVRKRLVSLRRTLSLEGGRPIAAENLHITLVFLGETDTARRECVEQALSTVDARAFDLVLGAVQYRPRGGMVWLAAREVPAAMRDLVGSLDAALTPCGHTSEGRFRAHVTLARNVPRFGVYPRLIPIVWKAADFCLVASRLTPQGSIYAVVRCWPLR